MARHSTDYVDNIVAAIQTAAKQADAIDPGFSIWLARAAPTSRLRELVLRAFLVHPRVGPALRQLSPGLFDPRHADDIRYAASEVNWAILATKIGPGNWGAWIATFRPNAPDPAGWAAFLDTYAATGVDAVDLWFRLEDMEIANAEGGRRVHMDDLAATPAGRANLAARLHLEPVARALVPAPRSAPAGVYAVLLGQRALEDIPANLRPHQALPGVLGQEVRTLRQARQAVELFVRSTGMGGSAMPKEFGLVVDPTNHVVARVSYNGRVWHTPYVPVEQAKLYEPGAQEFADSDLDQPISVVTGPARIPAKGGILPPTAAPAPAPALPGGPQPWNGILGKTQLGELADAVRRYGIDAHTLWSIAVLYRTEWNVPWKSAFTFAADYLKTPRGDPTTADAVLDHTIAGGTLFSQLSRDDNALAKALRMNWSRREGFWYRASSRGRQLPTVLLGRAAQEAKALGLSIAFEIEPPPGLEAAREAHRAAKESRAEVYEARAAKHAAASHGAWKAEHEIGKYIPLGQPILVGHHSERRARRDMERMQTLARKSVEEDKAAAHAASQAATVAAQAERYAPAAKSRLTQRGTGREGFAAEVLEAIKKHAKRELGAVRLGQYKHRGVLFGYEVTLPPRPGAEAWDRKTYVIEVLDGPSVHVWDRHNPAFPTKIRVAGMTVDQAVQTAFDEVRHRHIDPAYVKSIPVRGIER